MYAGYLLCVHVFKQDILQTKTYLWKQVTYTYCMYVDMHTHWYTYTNTLWAHILNIWRGIGHLRRYDDMCVAENYGPHGLESQNARFHHRSFLPRSSILRLQNGTRGEAARPVSFVPRARCCFSLKGVLPDPAVHHRNDGASDSPGERAETTEAETLNMRQLFFSEIWPEKGVSSCFFLPEKSLKEREKEGIYSRKRVLCHHLTWNSSITSLLWLIEAFVWGISVRKHLGRIMVLWGSIYAGPNESVRDHETFIKEITEQLYITGFLCETSIEEFTWSCRSKLCHPSLRTLWWVAAFALQNVNHMAKLHQAKWMKLVHQAT